MLSWSSNSQRRTIAFLSLIALAAAPLATAFFDEVASLRAELAQWQEVHVTADFSDVLEQLDDISGTVFIDTDDAAWYAPYVASLTDWGIVSGYRDEQGRSTGRFGPGDPVTVAEVLKMASEATETDVSRCQAAQSHPAAATHWSGPYVGCAEEVGVRLFTTGTPIELDRPASRSEVLVIVHDLFGDDVPALFATFQDTVQHPYESDIAYASLLQVVSGDSDEQGASTGKFRPDEPINRAEASKVIYLKLKDIAQTELF